jgi:iron(III) transport system substrate-binding protein
MILGRVRREWPWLALAGLVAVVVGAWPAAGPAQTPGGSVQEKLDRLEKLSGAERQRFLEEQAMKEGKVVMYTADDPVLIRAWNAAFKKRYPQLDVQFVRMTAPQTLQKSMAESQAGRPVADLLHVNAQNLAVLQKANLIARYVSPEARDFDADFKDPKGFWTVEWFDLRVVGFNGTAIKKADVPTTLEGLANPALKGKLGFVLAGGAGFVAGVLKAKGEAAGMELLKKIAAQEPRLYDSNTALGNAMASGQVPIGFDFLLAIAAKTKKTGAPIEWVVPDPLLVLPYYQLLMKDAPHPYAAALAYDWILSKEGQSFFTETDLIGPRKDMDYPAMQVDAMKIARQEGKKLVTLSAELLADPSRETKIFEDLFVRK